VAVKVRRRQVKPAIAIEVSSGYGTGIGPGGVVDRRKECRHAAVFQDFKVVPMSRGSIRATSLVLLVASARRQCGAEVLQPTVE
jgi:hypothetical protein